MGGIAILVCITLGYIVATLVGLIFTGTGPGASAWLVLGLTLALGGVGFADAVIKLGKCRKLGLSAPAKLICQLVTAIAFGVLILQFPVSNALTPGSTYLSFVREMPTFNIVKGSTVNGMIL